MKIRVQNDLSFKDAWRGVSPGFGGLGGWRERERERERWQAVLTCASETSKQARRRQAGSVVLHACLGSEREARKLRKCEERGWVKFRLCDSQSTALPCRRRRPPSTQRRLNSPVFTEGVAETGVAYLAYRPVLHVPTFVHSVAAEVHSLNRPGAQSGQVSSSALLCVCSRNWPAGHVVRFSVHSVAAVVASSNVLPAQVAQVLSAALVPDAVKRWPAGHEVRFSVHSVAAVVPSLNRPGAHSGQVLSSVLLCVCRLRRNWPAGHVVRFPVHSVAAVVPSLNRPVAHSGQV